MHVQWHAARHGEVTFTARNTGDKTHELVVLRTNVSQGVLPQTGSKVKERGAVRVVDEVEDVRPGSKRSLTVRLAPGRYVLDLQPGQAPSEFSRRSHAMWDDLR